MSKSDLSNGAKPLSMSKDVLIAQYWGQQVINYSYGFKNHVVSCVNINDGNSVLELYEPHSITDEHAAMIAIQNKFAGTSEEAKIKVGRDILKRVLESNQSLMCLPMESADFMRSKGYALPFNGWSIADQVHAGYVRLITRTEDEKRGEVSK